jgi:hypothetical protein
MLRLPFSGMWRHVVSKIHTNVSEEPAASIFGLDGRKGERKFEVADSFVTLVNLPNYTASEVAGIAQPV